MNHTVFLLYDSIRNSVFPGQVLSPLLDRDPEGATIVSFEKKFLSEEELKEISRKVRVIQLKRPTFYCHLSLWLAAYRFRKIYKKLCIEKGEFSVIARGPFAGWIARKSCKELVIQARGLVAEEFRYVQERVKPVGFKSSLSYYLRKFFYGRYKKLEIKAYKKRVGVKIETVSPALKKYLENVFFVDSKSVSVSYRDIPKKISEKTVGEWRKSVRRELRISPDTYIYCYAGSSHAWQSVDEMIDYFVEQSRYKKDSLLLVITKEKMVFEDLLSARGISRNSYRVICVPHEEIYCYLSAADVGLLFREADSVNWVSRPTKMLEYEAVGLKIIHNDTIAWLSKSF